MMFRTSFRFAATATLVLAFTLALGGSVCAQRSKGDEGTGGAAGYSPPIETPDANAPMQSRSIEIPHEESAPSPESALPQEKPKEKERPAQDGDAKSK
jgi:hypothetical protein